MNIEELMLKRRSCRKFTKEEVSKDDLNIILNCAMSGPSAHNRQPWEFFVVSNKEKLQELRLVTKYSDIEAPLAIVVCGNLNRAGLVKEDYWIQDCSAAVENILLAATALDYASLWIGVYPVKKAVRKTREIIGQSNYVVPLAIVLIGRAEEEKKPRSWYNEERVHYIE